LKRIKTQDKTLSQGGQKALAPVPKELVTPASVMWPLGVKLSSINKLRLRSLPVRPTEELLEIPGISEMDMYAIITCLLADSNEEVMSMSKRLFGGKPNCLIWSTRKKLGDKLNKYRPVFWNILTDWILGIDPENKIAIGLAAMRVQREKEKLDDSWMKYLAPKTVSYRFNKTFTINSHVRSEMKQRYKKSIDESNLFYDNPLKTMNYKKVKTFTPQMSESKKNMLISKKRKNNKMTVMDRYLTTGWDGLNELVVLEQQPTITNEVDSPDFELFNRFNIRKQAGMIIETIGTPNLRGIPTHMLENIIYSALEKGFIPKLDVCRYNMKKAYHRKSRVKFLQEMRPRTD